MNDQMFKSLIHSLLNDCPDLSLELKARIRYATDDRFCPIWWSVDDFEHRALTIEADFPESSPLFDREKFKEALECMCQSAGEDPDYGTTWDTVDNYLNDICRLEGVSCK
jgi:hypothetical protein